MSGTHRWVEWLSQPLIDTLIHYKVEDIVSMGVRSDKLMDLKSWFPRMRLHSFTVSIIQT
jgi:hypothetical protein